MVLFSAYVSYCKPMAALASPEERVYFNLQRRVPKVTGQDSRGKQRLFTCTLHPVAWKGSRVDFKVNNAGELNLYLSLR